MPIQVVMPKKEENPIGQDTQVKLRLNKINVTEFSFLSPPNEKMDEFISSLRANIESNYESEVDNDLFNLKMTVSFNRQEEKGLIEYIKLQVKFIYFLSPLNQITRLIYVEDKERRVFNHDNILLTMLGMSYSTCRGVFFERVGNTIYSPIILPPIDPKTLLSKAITK